MKIGIGHPEAAALDKCLDGLHQAEEAGFAFAAVPNIFGLDATMVCALAGRTTSAIELATAVVPTFPRHPHAMAQQALTAQAACDGRFVLGIGISHRVVIETMFGLKYDRLVRHVREYLEVLTSLLRTGSCSVNGELYQVNASLNIGNVPAPPILLGALRPQMIKLAGRLGDGTVTWMAGPKYVEHTVARPMNAAAAEAGRPTPRTCVGVPVCVTDDVDAAREHIASEYAVYGTLPVYRAVLDDEGAAGAQDIAIVGPEKTVEQGIRRFKDAGCTHFSASITPVGADRKASFRRTYEFLASLAPEL